MAGETPRPQEDDFLLTPRGEDDDFFLILEDSEEEKVRENKKSKQPEVTPAQTEPAGDPAWQELAEKRAKDLGEKPEPPPKPSSKLDPEKLKGKIEGVEKRKKAREESSVKAENQPNEPEIAEESETEKGQEEAKAVERPWAEHGQQREKSLYERLVKETELGKPLKEFVVKSLDAELDQKREEFLLKWFEDHKNSPEISSLGLPENLGDVQKKKVAVENGAFTKLILDYPKEFQEIENLSALRMDFTSDNVSMAGQFLALSHFENKREKLEEEIRSLRLKNNGSAEVEAKSKENQLDELLKVRMELAKKASGIDVEVQAEQELSNDEDYKKTKQQFIDENLRIEGHDSPYYHMAKEKFDAIGKQAFGENYSEQDKYYAKELISLKTGFSITDEQLCGLLKAGYDPRSVEDNNWQIVSFTIKETVKNFWNLGIIPMMKYSKGGELVSVKIGGKDELMMGNDFYKRAEELGKNLGAEIESQTEQELGKQWENDRELKKTGKINEIVSGVLENASKYVEQNYEAVKKRLVNEAEAKKPREKTKAEQKKIDQEFGDGKEKKSGKAKTIFESISELASNALINEHGERSGGLEKLTGELGDDADVLSAYFNKNLGVKEMTPAKLKKIVKNKDIYRESWGNKYGLIDWFVAIMADKPWESK